MLNSILYADKNGEHVFRRVLFQSNTAQLTDNMDGLLDSPAQSQTSLTSNDKAGKKSDTNSKESLSAAGTNSTSSMKQQPSQQTESQPAVPAQEVIKTQVLEQEDLATTTSSVSTADSGRARTTSISGMGLPKSTVVRQTVATDATESPVSYSPSATMSRVSAKATPKAARKRRSTAALVDAPAALFNNLASITLGRRQENQPKSPVSPKSKIEQRKLETAIDELILSNPALDRLTTELKDIASKSTARRISNMSGMLYYIQSIISSVLPEDTAPTTGNFFLKQASTHAVLGRSLFDLSMDFMEFLVQRFDCRGDFTYNAVTIVQTLLCFMGRSDLNAVFPSLSCIYALILFRTEFFRLLGH